MIYKSALVGACLGWTMAAVAFPQGALPAARAGAPPPLRQLGPRLAVSTESLGSVNAVRQLSDGRVIVNDGARRRLLLFDSSLSHAVVIIDSSGEARRSYGRRGGGIIRYTGDSTLFVDPGSLSMLVLDRAGVIARVLSLPGVTDFSSLASASSGAAFDARGRILYKRTGLAMNGPIRMSLEPGGASGPSVIHDSVAVLRVDLQSRLVDTAGFVRITNNPPLLNRTTASGATYGHATLNPIRPNDDWAAMSDGSVALVRGGDYHIDWIGPDGSRSATPPMAHEWLRLNDSVKAAIVDSARRANADRARPSLAFASGAQESVVDTADVVAASELPDYVPPFGPNAVMADVENQLWVRLTPTAALAGGPVYDVISRMGQIVDRVQFPPSLALVGFGPGVVYLTVREGATAIVAKYRVR